MEDIIIKADQQLQTVIESYAKGITWTRCGKVLKASKCPFFTAGETRFYLWPEKNCWITYGDLQERGGAVQFVMHMTNCSKAKAVAELERMFTAAGPTYKAKTEQVAPVADYEFEENEDFSAFELALLGNQKRRMKQADGSWVDEDTITSEALKRAFPIRSLKSFTYPAKEGADYSWKVYATEEFPIMYWKYQDAEGKLWGKIYQPRAEKGRRFTYFGKKEHSFMFSDNRTAEYMQRVKRGEGIDSEEKKDQVVIVSGGSDAINTYFNGGFNVVWLNSETDLLEDWQKTRLSRIFKRITVLYDLDETGVKYSYKMALRYLDITVAQLPEAMYRMSDKRYKDVKDFFTKWRTDDGSRRSDYFYLDKFKEFEYIIKNSLALKFWMDKMKEKDGEMVPSGVEIDNEQLYRFFKAYGLRKYSYSTDKFHFVKIQENTVEEIGDDKIAGVANKALRDYLQQNPQYFDKQLLNAINRSNQLRGQSLQNISEVNLDFTFDAKYCDYLFFRNGALKITANDMEMVPLEKLPFNIYRDKIIDFDFHIEKEPLFEIEYSEEYITSLETDSFPQLEKFTLKKNWKDFSYPQFIYNTGRVYWREEESGIELTENQRKEPDLNFVSKICALGYACRKHKEMTKAYMLMCVEDENNKNGEHNGGVGKSLFYLPLKFVRSVTERDGQLLDPKKEGDLLYVGVTPGKTDIVQFEDLQRGFPLQMLFNQVTGSMTIRQRYGNPVTIPFHESPVTILNSNHKPDDIDPSKRRRTWFCSFSSYYHPANPMQGIPERKPDQEFGKEMFKQYDTDEWNKTYHFMAQCIQQYMRINQRVLPVMDRVEKGLLINSITQNVYDWFNDFFDEYAETGSKLDTPIWRNDLYEEFKQIYSRNVQDRITIATLKEKLMKYCAFKRWKLNPVELYRSESEKRREEYRMSRNGKDDYFWYIQTKAISQNMMDDFRNRSVTPMEIIQPKNYYANTASAKPAKEDTTAQAEKMPF